MRSNPKRLTHPDVTYTENSTFLLDPNLLQLPDRRIKTSNNPRGRKGIGAMKNITHGNVLMSTQIKSAHPAVVEFQRRYRVSPSQYRESRGHIQHATVPSKRISFISHCRHVRSVSWVRLPLGSNTMRCVTYSARKSVVRSARTRRNSAPLSRRSRNGVND